MKTLKEIFSGTPVQPDSIGICLSGGGALGLAHIGVLQALEDSRIYPQLISGASMGSIIGSLYAAGYTPAQMLQLIKDGKLYRITKIMAFQPAFWKTGLSNHSNLLTLFKELIPDNSFENLGKPMHICVTNLTTGEWEIIDKSNQLDMWIAASCSIPGVYNAMKINDMIYVDGGLLNNMPAQPLKNKCSVIIGSDVIPYSSVKKNLRSRGALLASIRVSQHQNSAPGRALCTYLIEPRAIERYHEFSYEAFESIYQYGYRATVQFIASNPEILRFQTKTVTKK